MSVLDLLRDDLREFALYTAGDGDDSRVRLHANELPYRGDTDESARGLNRYPLGRDPRLTRRLADLYAVAPKNVLATRGSDDAIDLVIRAFCTAGQSRVVCTTPGFAMYPQLARLQGCDAIRVPLTEENDFAIKPESIVDACATDVALVFLCSPNNPTGRAMPLGDVRAVCDALAGRALVIVDEAYAEFSAVPSATTLLDDVPNLLVLRTMSKAYGLASARVGAAVAGADLIAVLDRLLMPFPLPAASVDAALAQTEPTSRARLRAQWRVLLSERERVTAALDAQARVHRVWPSDANFVLMSCAQPAALVDHCHARGLLVRLIRDDARRYVRVTIGQPEENDLFLGALAEQAA